MSDAEPYTHHLRIPSNASSTSSNASDSPLSHSPAYPSFDLYPLPFFNGQGTVDLNSHNYSHYASQSPISPAIGLMQPSPSFTHHGTNCTQIPKLRMACASGPNGHRSMWSLCEQCGAISMIDKD
ncbi:uncharacterized protein LACBIDRAFT_326529 [Laccaria bicolor S238N-H82]|uniref:Predicted protein n=1 Tax=Laccaria bicolor (strain S238N-H82 / ATCC MYA-4686) TaxID=486041 RepID=B0D8X0_LACBS|nr:uncharacterized protein LACBIDRAFT_326529 [Laccaria bicolor S238N-H82]EDR09145.1 predicted protein [Laccaria bicolor S238N-H82]|eukprot:XP_001880458.1 predicted protein [Laccaria bicolor S238N-H82]